MKHASKRLHAAGLLSARKKFGKYKDEEQKAVRKADVGETTTLAKLVAAWATFEPTFDGDGGQEELEERIKDIRASAEDVKEFCKYLEGALDAEEDGRMEKAGVFLSAVINTGCDSHYELDLWKIGCLKWLCSNNTKNVDIGGHVANSFAVTMDAGRVELFGNAVDVGPISGGTLVIHGTCESVEHYEISDGEIILWGNAGMIGDEMTGGKIVAKGKVKYIGYMEGGEIHLDRLPQIYDHKPRVGGDIYLKGELIVKDGEPVVSIERLREIEES